GQFFNRTSSFCRPVCAINAAGSAIERKTVTDFIRIRSSTRDNGIEGQKPASNKNNFGMTASAVVLRTEAQAPEWATQVALPPQDLIDAYEAVGPVPWPR